MLAPKLSKNKSMLVLSIAVVLGLPAAVMSMPENTTDTGDVSEKCIEEYNACICEKNDLLKRFAACLKQSDGGNDIWQCWTKSSINLLLPLSDCKTELVKCYGWVEAKGGGWFLPAKKKKSTIIQIRPYTPPNKKYPPPFNPRFGSFQGR